MLNVKESIIAALNGAGFRQPRFGAWIRRINADIHDFRNFQTPLTNNLEPLFVPVRIGDQVDGDGNAKRTGKLQGLKILSQRNAFAMLEQSLFVDGLDSDEHIFKAERLPEGKYVFIPKQHVAARLQIIFLFDAFLSNRFANRQAMLALDEGHIVHDKHARFLDSPQVFHRLIRADHAVTATVERPGAAEGTIPWTAARKFNGGAWVEDTDEIFFAMAQQITRGADGVEGLDKTRRPVQIRKAIPHRARGQSPSDHAR